jgi:hypothetical protein
VENEQKQAYADIQTKLAQIDKLYTECTELADKFEVEFSVDGPSYGMGGGYSPRTVKSLVENGYLEEDELAEMDPEAIEDYLDEHAGWNASSQSCYSKERKGPKQCS